MEDEIDIGIKVKKEPRKAHNLPFLPEEEEMSEEEVEQMLQERYKNVSRFVTYAEDDYETKGSFQRNILMLSTKDSTIWKVKCMVGCENHSAFGLMQKYVDLQSFGTKLQLAKKSVLYIDEKK
ncbi:hypothetical protein L1049_010458 [Liquidambar formosana]|uniref:Uncharacterized protein n=1 Tax=Liquidambar formosana TaxID=63359 RepID=A0AAP0R4E9_LIQFO